MKVECREPVETVLGMVERNCHEPDRRGGESIAILFQSKFANSWEVSCRMVSGDGNSSLISGDMVETKVRENTHELEHIAIWEENAF